MNRNDRPYTSYLLRLWQIQGDQGPVWRASLENPQTGERQGFATMQDLFTFLTEQTDLTYSQSLTGGNR
jgi:hypothetical protein